MKWIFSGMVCPIHFKRNKRGNDANPFAANVLWVHPYQQSNVIIITKSMKPWKPRFILSDWVRGRMLEIGGTFTPGRVVLQTNLLILDRV